MAGKNGLVKNKPKKKCFLDLKRDYEWHKVKIKVH